MDITLAHIASKKKIGTLGSRPVFEIATTGGLHLVVALKGTGVETLGSGPHRAVARFIAQKRHEDLKLTDLAKNEEVSLDCFRHLLSEFEALTDRCNALLKL